MKDKAEPASDADESQIAELLTLTPTERLIRHEQALELVLELRKAGTRLYGFDPRAVIEDESSCPGQ